MGAKTRTSKPVASKKKDEASAPAPAPTLASVDNPPHLFVLPKHASPNARITTIPNPATSAPDRYFVCPENGFFEFTRIAAPRAQPTSWLLAPNTADEDQESGEEEAREDTGYVLQTPDMFVATPIDPLFLLVPSLAGDVDNIGQEYLAPSDYLSKLAETAPHLSQFLQPASQSKLKRRLENRIEAVCDYMDMGDEKMYALSLDKLAKVVFSKAKRMALKGLPSSMDRKFIKQALDVPVLNIKREHSNISIANEDATPSAENEPFSDEQSQDTNTSSSTTAMVPTVATSVSIVSTTDVEVAPVEVTDLFSLRVALNFLLKCYFSPSLRKKIDALASDVQTSEIDFSPLDRHLKHIASLKKEAQALRSLSDNISRKRSAVEDDDEAVQRMEVKKRKKEDEENRKKNTSHGVKRLMKADTSGMKKMSSFFAKAAAK